MTPRSLTGQTMISAKWDMARFNYWFEGFRKLKKITTEQAVRKTALDLTTKIMKSSKVRTGRYRMGWSGVYGMMNVPPPPVVPNVSDTSSILGRKGRISAIQAQKEGVYCAAAKERKQGAEYSIEIRNAVVYGPVEEARRGNVRASIKHMEKYFRDQVMKAIEKAGKESQQ